MRNLRESDIGRPVRLANGIEGILTAFDPYYAYVDHKRGVPHADVTFTGSAPPPALDPDTMQRWASACRQAGSLTIDEPRAEYERTGYRVAAGLFLLVLVAVIAGMAA